MIPLLFHPSNIGNHLILNDKVENLTSIIEKNIYDQNTKKRLTRWLGLFLDDYIVGLTYFLPYSFNQVSLSDLTILYNNQLQTDLDKSQLVIREVVERFIDRLDGYDHEGPI